MCAGSFYPSTSGTTSVRADFSILERYRILVCRAIRVGSLFYTKYISDNLMKSADRINCFIKKKSGLGYLVLGPIYHDFSQYCE